MKPLNTQTNNEWFRSDNFDKTGQDFSRTTDGWWCSLCLLLWCKEEGNGSIKPQSRSAYQSLEAKLMKRNIFACFRDYIVTCNNGASGSEPSWGFAWQNFQCVKFLKVVLDAWSNILFLWKGSTFASIDYQFCTSFFADIERINLY